MFNAIDRYEELIDDAIRDGKLKEYIADFLSERNKKYHGETCTRWFRQALTRKQPDMIEWFDRIMILR